MSTHGRNVSWKVPKTLRYSAVDTYLDVSTERPRCPTVGWVKWLSTAVERNTELVNQWANYLCDDVGRSLRGLPDDIPMEIIDRSFIVIRQVKLWRMGNIIPERQQVSQLKKYLNLLWEDARKLPQEQQRHATVVLEMAQLDLEQYIGECLCSLEKRSRLNNGKDDQCHR